MSEREKQKQANKWTKRQKKVRQKGLSRGKTSVWLKKSKRTFNSCCWGPLSLSRLMCDQPASWIKMSHALWNGQNKTGSERGRQKETERWKDWEERERERPYLTPSIPSMLVLAQRKLASVTARFAGATARHWGLVFPGLLRDIQLHSTGHGSHFVHTALVCCAAAKVGKSVQDRREDLNWNYKTLWEHAPLPKRQITYFINMLW